LLSIKESITRLIEGNTRFASGSMKHPRLDAAVRSETLDNGQHPFAAVLSCADSRVPAEIIFDQGIGDIFSIRNAGNIVDDTVVGSFELCVYKFNTPLLVVLAHTDCGAVKLAIKNDLLYADMSKIIRKIRPVAELTIEAYPELTGNDLLTEVIKSNALKSIQELIDKSELIRERVEEDRLQVMAGIYYLEDGSVKWL